MMTLEQFQTEFGPCVPWAYAYDCNIVREVNSYRSLYVQKNPDSSVKEPFLNGALWTWGYFQSGVSPDGELDYHPRAAALRVARELHQIVCDADLLRSSEADVPYAPFVAPYESMGDFLEGF